MVYHQIFSYAGAKRLCITCMRTVVLPLLLILGSCSKKSTPAIDYAAVALAAKPKNIILLIGDGMGMAQMSAHIYWKGAGKSIFEKMPIVGYHKSHSCNDLVTDSAAGATAFSCGKKTSNGAIGVLPPDNTPCTTILEDVDRRGMATGMVVACTATHATPASFIAHREMRAFTEEIAMDYLKTELDCFIGGGEALFNNRPDKRNLLDTLKKHNYLVKRSTSFGFMQLEKAAQQNVMVFTAEREPPTASGGRRYLPSATRAACDFLRKRSEKGFFLMVEGSQIDWAGHANDRNWLKVEMEDFEKTVRQAMNFAAENKETLVIITGDHECGGLSLNQADSKRTFKPAFSTRTHTGALVPVYAYGPQAELFSGLYDNTEIYRKMRMALGVE